MRKGGENVGCETWSERRHCVVCTLPEIPYEARDDFINTEFHHSLSKHILE